MSPARLAVVASGTLVMLCATACSKDRPAGTSPDAGPTTIVADASTAATMLSREEGRALMKNACLSCHSEEMLAQQRLTLPQWTKTVTKMVGWGANLEPNDTAGLTAWLAASYGPDAGPYEAAPVDVAAAQAELAALPDGPLGNGDAERGRALYTDRCSGCHGPEARGHIGVSLVDRPLLYRAADLAQVVRRGRGKMTPMTITDPELADVLAHLRRLKNP